MPARVANKITKEEDLKFLFNLKEEDITLSLMTTMFGEINGKRRFNPYDELIVPPNTYGPEGHKINKTIYTTVGIWLFNIYFIEKDLFDLFGYYNKTLNKKNFNALNQIISYAILEDRLSVDVLERFCMKTQHTSPLSNIICPSGTEKMQFCLKTMKKKKAELLKQYAKDIEEGNVEVVDTIEKELMNYAREYLKDDPGMDLFNSGFMGSFENNFKNMYLMKGAVAIQDPNSKKEYNIITSSYAEGIGGDEYTLLADSLVAGPYYRSKKTESGGYWEKLFRNAFQHIVLLPEGSDCGTTDTITVKLTKDIANAFMYSYVQNGAKLIEITSENIDSFIDKEVKIRFPTMCKSKNGICSKCAGNMYYRIGIKNAGISLTKIPSTLKNVMMKNFHDSTVQLLEMDPEEMFNLKN